MTKKIKKIYCASNSGAGGGYMKKKSSIHDDEYPEITASDMARAKYRVGMKDVTSEEFKDDIAAAIHETASGLFKIGLISAKSMREFDRGCLTQSLRGALSRSKLVL